MKAFVPKGGIVESSGVSDDDDFAKANNLQPAGGPPISISATELAREFKTDKAAAEAKYKDKNLLVEGKLSEITYGFDGEVNATLEGTPPDTGKLLGVTIRCVAGKADANKILGLSRGQTVKFKGKGGTLFANLFVDVVDAKFESAGADPAPTVSATGLLLEHAKNPTAADEKYNEKAIVITGAVVDSKENDSTLIVVSGAKGKVPTTKIKVSLPLDAKGQIANLKPGEKVKAIRGEYSSSDASTIYINRAYIAP